MRQNGPNLAILRISLQVELELHPSPKLIPCVQYPRRRSQLSGDS